MKFTKLKTAISTTVLAVTLCTDAYADLALGTVAQHRSVIANVHSVTVDMTQGTKGTVIAHLSANSPDSVCPTAYPKVDIANVGMDAAKMMMDVFLAAQLSGKKVQVHTAYCVENSASIIRVRLQSE